MYIIIICIYVLYVYIYWIFSFLLYHLIISMQWYTSLACMKHGFWHWWCQAYFMLIRLLNTSHESKSCFNDRLPRVTTTADRAALPRKWPGATVSFFTKIKGAVTYNYIQFPFTFIYLVGKTGRYLSTQGYLFCTGWLFVSRDFINQRKSSNQTTSHRLPRKGQP